MAAVKAFRERPHTSFLAPLPGEVIAKPVVEYLRTGLAAGMLITDAADGSLDTIRVVAR